MSAIRTPTQVHDGFATIRTRGLCRTRSRAEQIDRCRASTDATKTDFNNLNNDNCKNNFEFLQKQCEMPKIPKNSIDNETPYYSSPKSLPCSTFRPPLPPQIPSNNNEFTASNKPIINLSPEYQNVVKKSQFSLESLASSSTTPLTPNDDHKDDDDIFMYSAPESPQYCNIAAIQQQYRRNGQQNNHQHHRSFGEIEGWSGNSINDNDHESPRREETFQLQNLSHKPSTKKPPPPTQQSRVVSKKTSFTSTDCKNDGSNGEINSIGSSSNGSYNINTYSNPLYNNIYDIQQKRFYSNFTTSSATNPFRSSSTELLSNNSDVGSDRQFDCNEFIERKPFETFSRHHQQLNDDYHRRYHTLGHPRSNTSTICNPKSMTMQMMMMQTASNNSIADLSSMTSNKNIKSSWQDGLNNQHNRREFNINDINVDPLDFKIGCQTMLRSKPIIPWYELAIRKDLKRKSCPPPLTTVNQNTIDLTEEAHRNLKTQQRQHKYNYNYADDDNDMDAELNDMRNTIELLRRQSMKSRNSNCDIINPLLILPARGSMDNIAVGNRQQHQNFLLVNQTNFNQHQITNDGAKNIQQHQPTISTGGPATTLTNERHELHESTDSICSMNSICSNNSIQDKKKSLNIGNGNKRNWIRNSLTRAFSRNSTKSNGDCGSSGRHRRHSGSSNCSNDLNENIPMTAQLLSRNGGGEIIQKLGTTTMTTVGGKTITSRNSLTSMDSGNSFDIINNGGVIDTNSIIMIEDLKKQLREKDLIITDIRLEALSSASQMENLKEIVIKLRDEIKILKEKNERLENLLKIHLNDNDADDAVNFMGWGSDFTLEKLLGERNNHTRKNYLSDRNVRLSRGIIAANSSVDDDDDDEISSPPSPLKPDFKFTSLSSATNNDCKKSFPLSIRGCNNNDSLYSHQIDGKKIAISVFLGHPENLEKHMNELNELENCFAERKLISVEIHNDDNNGQMTTNGNDYANLNLCGFFNKNDFIIANTYISGKTTWQHLDNIVKKSFKDYLMKIDPGTNLGLNIDCISAYRLGEVKRNTNVIGYPEFLPYGYIIGNVKTIHICLKDIGSLAFDCLIPRSIMHRYISLLVENKRLILCGPSGTGKSFIARKLAEFIVPKLLRNFSKAIAIIDVKSKSSTDLINYIDKVVFDSCKSKKLLPSVIILENLSQTSRVDDIFACLRKADPMIKLPYIIGTITQATTSNIANLQLHNNFRWVMLSNQMEPVKGLLGRCLRQRLATVELQNDQQHQQQSELNLIVNWLPKLWQQINRYLECNCNSGIDVTISQNKFLKLPLNIKESQIWFTELWNNYLSPYIAEKVQLYGKREKSQSNDYDDAEKNPLNFIRDTYPWSYSMKCMPSLNEINVRDDANINLMANHNHHHDHDRDDDEKSIIKEIEKPDPLLNILIRLRDAKIRNNQNINQNPNIKSNNDSEEYDDCISIGSSSSPDSSASN